MSKLAEVRLWIACSTNEIWNCVDQPYLFQSVTLKNWLGGVNFLVLFCDLQLSSLEISNIKIHFGNFYEQSFIASNIYNSNASVAVYDVQYPIV